MLRFVLIIIIFFPHCLYFYFAARKVIKNKNSTPEERYGVVRKIIGIICKKSRITVYSYGQENLPKEDGYALLVNHQGRFDGLALIKASERKVSFLIDQTRSNVPIEKTVVDALGCVRMNKSDLVSVRQAMRDTVNVLEGGGNIAIFPEGQDGDNKNNLQEFKTGAICFVERSKRPMVPVCLYDTYKVYGINSLRKVSCQVHFLKPITYDEYKDLSKDELTALIKSRMADKLEELKSKETEN